MARRALPKGWTQGDVGELLDLSEVEEAIVELRVRLAETVRARRAAQGVTQKQLAGRIGSSQPRVARLEQADASIEMMLRALFALGADLSEIGRLLAA